MQVYTSIDFMLFTYCNLLSNFLCSLCTPHGRQSICNWVQLLKSSLIGFQVLKKKSKIKSMHAKSKLIWHFQGKVHVILCKTSEKYIYLPVQFYWSHKRKSIFYFWESNPSLILCNMLPSGSRQTSSAFLPPVPGLLRPPLPPSSSPSQWSTTPVLPPPSPAGRPW